MPGEAVARRACRRSPGGRRRGLPAAAARCGQPLPDLPAASPAAASPLVEVGHGSAGVAPLVGVRRLWLRLEALAAVGRVRQRVLARVVRRGVGVGRQD